MKSSVSILVLSLFSARCWAIECGPAIAEVGKQGTASATHAQPSTPKIETVVSSKNVYQINLKTASGGTVPKRVRILPKDDWGGPAQLKGKNFTVAIPVESKTEGILVLQEIARVCGFISPSATIDMAANRMGMDVNPEIYASFHKAERTPINDEHVLELQINFQSAATPATAQQILTGLNKLGLTQTASQSIDFDLSTYSGCREWGYYSFYDWAHNLSREETKALRDLGGPDYKEIHSALRKGETNSRWKPTIEHLDQALAKSSLNRDVVTYRASSQPELLKAWQQLRENSSSSIPLAKDPAFIFSTLRPEVADWWNKSQLGGKGMIVEIRAPRGAHAGYIDAEGILVDRGYQEIVFPRNMGARAVEAKQSPDGKPILVVELRPQN